MHKQLIIDSSVFTTVICRSFSDLHDDDLTLAVAQDNSWFRVIKNGRAILNTLSKLHFYCDFEVIFLDSFNSKAIISELTMASRVVNINFPKYRFESFINLPIISQHQQETSIFFTPDEQLVQEAQLKNYACHTIRQDSKSLTFLAALAQEEQKQVPLTTVPLPKTNNHHYKANRFNFFVDANLGAAEQTAIENRIRVLENKMQTSCCGGKRYKRELNALTTLLQNCETMPILQAVTDIEKQYPGISNKYFNDTASLLKQLKRSRENSEETYLFSY